MVFVVIKLHSMWYTTLFIKKLAVPGTEYDVHISSSTCYIKQGKLIATLTLVYTVIVRERNCD